MTKDEFKRFFAQLRRYFPFSYNEASAVREWYDELKGLEYDLCLRSIKNISLMQKGLPASQKEPPTAFDVSKNVIECNGVPSLIWKSLKQRELQSRKKNGVKYERT